MKLVYVAKNWHYPDLMRQTPGCHGTWDDIQFTLDAPETCDYVIILNRICSSVQLRCPPEHIWAIIQEPPDKAHKAMQRSSASVHRVHTQDPSLKGKRYIHSQPALPWHVNRDYDYLTSCNVPDKVHGLSWITSNKALSLGHRSRLRFLEQVQRHVEFDLFGKGFRYIEDKWDGLAPYRYSIAVENFRNPFYWSEKISDCFLAWTMPIYCGCTRIAEYFPPESMVQVDIHDPTSIDRIREVASSDLWEKSLDAIAYARNLVLNKYQLFPFIAGEISNHEDSLGSGSAPVKVDVTISNRMRAVDTIATLPNRIRRWLNRGLLFSVFIFSHLPEEVNPSHYLLVQIFG